MTGANQKSRMRRGGDGRGREGRSGSINTPDAETSLAALCQPVTSRRLIEREAMVVERGIEDEGMDAKEREPRRMRMGPMRLRCRPDNDRRRIEHGVGSGAAAAAAAAAVAADDGG